MSYNGCVFCRPAGAVILGFPYGHVGFGFQVDDHTYCVGAVEVVNGQTRHDLMNFWTALTDDPLRFMCTQNPYGPLTRYDMAKMVAVPSPVVAAAQSKMKTISQIDYNLFSQNCRTDTVEILEAYGVTGLPGGSRPSGFFGGVAAPIQPLLLPWPTYMLDVSLYTQTDQFGLRDDVNLTEDGVIADPACNQRADGNPDAPQPIVSCVAVRRGYVALYPDQSYQGEPVQLSAGQIKNFRDLPWADKTIRSYCASSQPFDATGVDPQADPRFNNPTERDYHIARLQLPPYFGAHLQSQVTRNG